MKEPTAWITDVKLTFWQRIKILFSPKITLVFHNATVRLSEPEEAKEFMKK